MEMRKIPHTDLEVSVLGLGTMTFGTPVGEDEAVRLVLHALELGINFIDTANMYEGYARYVGSPGGVAEQILGRGLRGRRHEVVLATKVGMKIGPAADDEGLVPAHIRRECDRSLKRLDTDVIDLYYMHKPDPNTPVADSIETFAELVRAGKVRHWGLSNHDPGQVTEVLELCDDYGWPRPVAHQPPFSLLRREAEADLLPLCRREELAVVPYQVLQGGLLTGKYRRGSAPPAGSRAAAKPDWLPQLAEEAILDALDRLAGEAEAAGMSLLQYSLRTTAAIPGITSLIVGATRPQHLDAAAAALRESCEE